MPTNAAPYAGIDAGGTGTRCVVADARGAISGVGRAGPGNVRFVGHAAAGEAIRTAFRQALGPDTTRTVAHLHMAVAGTLLPDGLEDLAATWSSGNDAQAALAGGLVEGPGLIVIAGTGSVCYGRSADGRETLLGGWGPLAGDEGSGYAIGRAALQHLTRVLDHRLPHDLLSATLMAHLEVRDRRGLLDYCYEPPVPRDAVAALAGQVAWAAERGDRTARALLAHASTDLAEAAAALAGQLDLRGEDARVALLGGIFATGTLILTPFRQRMRRLAPGVQILPARFPPVIGALFLGYLQAGVAIDECLLARLERTAQSQGLHSLCLPSPAALR